MLKYSVLLILLLSACAPARPDAVFMRDDDRDNQVEEPKEEPEEEEPEVTPPHNHSTPDPDGVNNEKGENRNV